VSRPLPKWRSVPLTETAYLAIHARFPLVRRTSTFTAPSALLVIIPARVWNFARISFLRRLSTVVVFKFFILVSS